MDSKRIAYGGLGYLGIAAPDPAAWLDYAIEVCGLMPAQIPPGKRAGLLSPAPEAGGISADGTAYLKMDDRQWRIAVHPADEPGLRYVGFEIGSLGDLEIAVETLRERGTEVRLGSADEQYHAADHGRG